MTDFIQRGWGSVWVQTDPAEPFALLTCVGAATVTVPRRPREARYCPDPTRAGQYKIKDFIKGEADLPGTTLTQPYQTVYDFLVEQKCDFQLRINHTCEDSDKTVFQNYIIAQHLHGAEFTSGEIEDPVSMQPGDEDRIMTSGELVSRAFKLVKKLDGTNQTANQVTPVSEAINDMAALPARCFSPCNGKAVDEGEVVWAAVDTAGYLAGDPILYTTDFGASWNVTTTEPFLGARDCLSVVIVQIASNNYRVLVAGGALADNYAAVSYSDDQGATWVDITVGTVDGQGINMLWRDELGRIWAAADGGYIYVSETQGETWVAKAEGAPSTENLVDIVFYDDQTGYVVGENNEFWCTNDGGNTWATRGGPAGASDTLYTVAVNHVGHIFIGGPDGALYRSINGGEDWTLHQEFGGGTGIVKRIRFERDLLYFGYLAWNDGLLHGYLYRSEDGGPSWVQQEYIANDGIHAVLPVDTNYVYVGGEPSIAVAAFIARYIRSAST